MRVLDYKKTSFLPPDYAPIHESLICERCKKSVMSIHIVKKDGKVLCLSCSGEKFFELDGHGMKLCDGKMSP